MRLGLDILDERINVIYFRILRIDCAFILVDVLVATSVCIAKFDGDKTKERDIEENDGYA